MSKLKKRQILVELSDEDVNELCDMVGCVDDRLEMNVSHLFEQFVSDLIANERSGGIHERRCIHKWYVNSFELSENKSLLFHLVCNDIDPRGYMEAVNRCKYLEQIKYSIGYFEYDDYLEEVDAWNETLELMLEGWLYQNDVDMDREHQRILRWIEERNRLLFPEEVVDEKEESECNN